MDKLIIYKASAGSGKTYKLTEEFLKLAFSKPFHHILAVTFTNKATAEMKQRIIAELYRLASGQDSTYLEVLMRETGQGEDSLRNKAGTILEGILHNFGRLSVGTIDSFFQRIIRGFARETGLQAGFELELDNRKVLEKAVERLIPETENDPSLERWLADFAESRIREGRSWNFRDDIGRLGQQVFREEFLRFGKGLAEKLSDRSFMDGYLNSLYALRRDFENAMKGLGERALKMMGERSLEVGDFSYGANGVAGYFINISRKKRYEPGVRALSAADNPEGWYTGRSPKKDIIALAVDEGLNSCLKEAFGHYSRHYPAYLTAGLIVSYFHTLGILNDITRNIREYLEENNLFLLSDVAVLLGMIISGNDSPFIYEKTGHHYHHFMIDEFQDTSRMQWENFAPLIRNSLSENNRNIIVGDVKQSIYRWRNGDWKILAAEIGRDMVVFGPRTVPLDTNWRSRETVVKFNNALFDIAPQIIRQQFAGEFEGSGLPEGEGALLADQMAGAYHGHVQKVPGQPGKEGGFVSVRFLEEEGEAGWKERVIEGLPALLLDIRERGYPLRDIAILVRDNREGRLVASGLMEWQSANSGTPGRRLDFISEEFLLLGESHHVRLLIALMKYIAGPDDDINRAFILNEYCSFPGRAGVTGYGGQGEQATSGTGAGQKEMDGRSGPKVTDDHAGQKLIDGRSGLSGHHLFGLIEGGDDGWLRYLPAGFGDRAGYLGRLPLFDLVEELISLFGLHRTETEIPYLLAFQDLIIDFTRREAGGLHSFLEWWEENGPAASVSSSEKQDALRIMTIHKAKGLQFGVVIVPFGDWRIDNDPRHDNILWCSPRSEPFNRLELVPVRYGTSLAASLFAREYFTEKMQAFVDNLNLLYVALTRAVSELHAFAPLPAKTDIENGRVKSTGNLLFKAFTSPFGDGDADRIALHEHWNADENAFVAGRPVVIKVGEGLVAGGDDLRVDSYTVNDYRERLRLRLRGNIFFAGDRDKQKRIDEGRLMHMIFEKIITAGDVEKAVRGQYYSGVIDLGEAGGLTARIGDHLKDERVAFWFDGSMKVMNEAAILLPGGELKRPDRVMVKGDEITVVDYKFGEQSNPAYTRQVRGYMKEVAKMGYRPVRGFIWYVTTGIIEEVHHE